ncbi:hypothetical protein A8C32_09400 [Flavivirga aquatica]|uniref:Lipoprotein n=1 Tax=Flavivirga aquatica TaxID=1849968 RepID=A0A1E5SJY3_9FLAO|nr:hypothetical protein [Flavivirga aquatica]OEJ99366.1 hypothetical protein A8C32_09400 [Flavivirga aquatica]
MKYIYINFCGCLLFIALASCNLVEKKDSKSYIDNKETSSDNAFVEITLSDTLKLNKKQKIEIAFFHPFNDSINFTDEDFKVIDACLIFSPKKKLLEMRRDFDKKCDSVLPPSSKINDTILFSFYYTPTILGNNSILIKMKEKNYLKPHKDSTRVIAFNYFLEKDFFVVPPR